MAEMILRVVARGETDESEDFDMDAPADLVALEVCDEGEVEVGRKEFASGHAASEHLLGMLRR